MTAPRGMARKTRHDVSADPARSVERSRRVSAAATPPGAAEQDPSALLTADAALREEMRTLNSRLAAFEAEALSRHSQTARRFREAGL